jgi:uncharacterized glyoxalase superfamily protein PhnB
MTGQTTGGAFYPYVLYGDAAAAMEWLERVLGFERREEHRDDDGAIQHAEMTFGSQIVMVGSAGIGREPFRSLPAGGSLIYCAVDDIAGLYERAREAGADIPLELTDTDYGSRDFTVRDPEGNLWSFGTYRPTVEGG